MLSGGPIGGTNSLFFDIANVLEATVVDGMCRLQIEHCNLIEADTCHSEALLRSEFFQDILLVPREIKGPVASLL